MAVGLLFSTADIPQRELPQASEAERKRNNDPMIQRFVGLWAACQKSYHSDTNLLVSPKKRLLFTYRNIPL